MKPFFHTKEAEGIASHETRAETFTPLLGNGALFCRFHGATLCGIRPDYGAPSMLSVTPVFPKAQDSSAHCVCRNELFHRFTFSKSEKDSERTGERDSEKDVCVMRDALFDDKAIYVRQISTDMPFTLATTSPAYVKTARFASYRLITTKRKCLMLTAREGLPLGEELTAPHATTLLLLLTGNAAFDESGNVAVGQGESALFVIGNTAKEVLVSGEEALKLTLPELFHRDFLAEKENLSAFPLPLSTKDYPAQAPQSTKDDGSTLKMLPPAAYTTLLAHQAKSGGMASSFDRPYAVSEEAPLYVKAFLAMGLAPRAKKLLLFFYERYRMGGFAPFYPLGSQRTPTENPACHLPALSGLPVLQAALLYFKDHPDRALFETLFPMMKAALYEANRHMTDNTLPFSGAERLFAHAPSLCVYMFDASLANTLCYADCAEELRALAERFGTSLPRDTGFISRTVCNIRSTLGVKFSVEETDNEERGAGQGTAENAPAETTSNEEASAAKKANGHKSKLSCHGVAHRKGPKGMRFAYLVCLGCLENEPFPHKGLLERYADGIYLCPSCLAHAQSGALTVETQPCRETVAYEQSLAAMIAALSPTGREVLGKEFLASLLEKTTNCLEKEKEGLQDALLLAAKAALDLPFHDLLKQIATQTDRTGLLAARYYGASPLTAPPDAAALALLATVLPL